MTPVVTPVVTPQETPLVHAAFDDAGLAVSAECAPGDPRLPTITARCADGVHLLYVGARVMCDGVRVVVGAR